MVRAKQDQGFRSRVLSENYVFFGTNSSCSAPRKPMSRRDHARMMNDHEPQQAFVMTSDEPFLAKRTYPWMLDGNDAGQ